jgi:hypothetical protein
LTGGSMAGVCIQGAAFPADNRQVTIVQYP